MTISTRIRGELFTSADEAADAAMDTAVVSPQLIRLPLTRPPDVPTTGRKKRKSSKKKVTKPKHQVKVEPMSLRHGLPWTTDEHDRFLQGLEQFPSGPWKAIAAHVGTRTPRQTMTHAQKYRQKIQRRRRGLLTSSRQPVPVTSELYCGLVITTTNVDECSVSPVTSNSPTAVDAAFSAAKQNIAPLESNWFDKVAMEELDAAFHAFLEVYDPMLFPMDDDEGFPASLANINDAAADCNTLDGASIVL